MGKKFFALAAAALLLMGQVNAADFIRWVDFDVSCEAMERALGYDVRSQEQEKRLPWIDILALAATRHGGGDFSVQAVDAAAKALCSDESMEQQLGEQYKYYVYFKEAYTAVLGGLVGNFAIETTDSAGKTERKPQYGLRAFSPIAAGYGYAHYDDFGASRSYGYRRRHLGNDLLGALGTPICAVEAGTVEALGWNQYGGWRVGIRSLDRKRYYYYAHLRKDFPFNTHLKEGDTVAAGEVIGYLGMTGYSTKENVNNINIAHLHFGMQIIFDEVQKDGNNEIWIDVYEITEFLNKNKSAVEKPKDDKNYRRKTEFYERLLTENDGGG